MTPPSKRPAYANRYAKMHRAGIRLMVDATPTRRKAQALAAIGYSRAMLGPVVGVQDVRNVSHFLHGKGAKVTRAVATAMDEFYEANCMKPISTPVGKRAATSARKEGFAPPAAWDDINDIHERPKGVRWNAKRKAGLAA